MLKNEDAAGGLAPRRAALEDTSISNSITEPPSFWLFAGTDAWTMTARWIERHEPGESCAVLPPGADPGAYSWDDVAGLTIIVIWPDATEGEALPLVRELLAAGAIVVRVATLDGPHVYAARGAPCRR